MKYKNRRWSMLLFLPCYLLLSVVAWGQEVRMVQVIDAEMGTPMVAVHVLGEGYHGHTDAEGYYRIPPELAEELALTFTFVGYVPQTFTVAELGAMEPAVINLRFSSEALSELVVEQQAPIYTRSTVGEMLSSDALQLSLGSSLGESLAEVKGVTLLSNGTSGGRPVIHGLHGHRILIINNGIRQEGQQWGHDHAPEIDLSAAGAVSVLKGAEAVRYGADALGGAIVVEQPPLPYEEGPVSGSLTALYASNGRAGAMGGLLEGGIGKSGTWAWRAQWSGLSAGDHATARYLLNNTGERQTNLSLAIGNRGDKYSSDLYYSLVHNKSGVFRGAQLGNEGLLQERLELGRPIDVDPFSRHIDYPYHQVVHHLVRLKALYDLNTHHRLSLQVAYQHDQRKEFQIRRANRSHMPNLSLTLDNLQGNLGWEGRLGKDWDSQVGLHGSYTNNYNEAGTGVVPMIPNYVQASAGLFMIQKYHRERWGMEAGVRLDHLYLNASGIDMYSNSYGGDRRLSNITYTLGGYFQPLDALQIKSQLGTAWRAPHVSELYSEGVDHAAGIYLRGDEEFGSERATKWITSATYSSEELTVSLEGYLQWIANYIYQEPTGQYKTVVSGAYPLFQYKQVPATLHGMDAEVTWRPRRWLEYKAQSGMLWAAEQATGRYLPFIPPFHFSQSLRVSLPFWEETSVALRHDYVAEQKRFDPETDLVDSAPPAYQLQGVEGSTRFQLTGHRTLSLHIAIHNLLNREYKEYTNRARYYSHSAGRDVRLTVKYHF
ncbi:MAG: TonB-dependent receptor [Porphyromonas sp.]|nr:TonB-dependent receptor [Porphyromonas sp.]